MYIKSFGKFKMINESMKVFSEGLLSSVNATDYDLFSSLNISSNSLDVLNNSNNFVLSLSSKGLRKSTMELSSDYETFLSSPCKFILIFKINSSDLENPEYILIQFFDKKLNKWSDTKCYKINGQIKKFYDKLSSKTIEIIDGNDKYVYETSDKNTWILISAKDSDIYKKTMSKENLEKTIKSNKAKVNII